MPWMPDQTIWRSTQQSLNDDEGHNYQIISGKEPIVENGDQTVPSGLLC